MCLAIPAKIIAISNNTGEVELAGVLRKVSLDLTPEAKLGDYVLVHAGFAIQVVDESEAMETLKLLKEIMDHEAS